MKTKYELTRRIFVSNIMKYCAAIGTVPFAVPSLTSAKHGGAHGTATGFVDDPSFETHILQPGHPESPQRLQEIRTFMGSSGLLNDVTKLTEEIDPVDPIKAIHTAAHHDTVAACNPSGPVAAKAVAMILGAAKAVSDGTVRNAFCAIRPPGHHANNNSAAYDGPCQGEGFCFYSNVAIAAQYARQVLGHKKVLIVDWDYHHGNGTENAFYSEPDVLFFSTHDLYAYPGTGDSSRTGEGAGTGFNINAPLDRGANDSDLLKALEEQLLPKAQQFKPDFIIISAGFDSREQDTLGLFSITDCGFSRATKLLMDLADSHCSGRILSVLEGGYNVTGLASAVVAHVGTLQSGAIMKGCPAGTRSIQFGSKRRQIITGTKVDVAAVDPIPKDIIILNSQGRRMRHIAVNGQNAIHLDRLGLPRGRYIVELRNSKARVKSLFVTLR